MKEDFIERLNNNNATFQCLSFYEHNILRKEFPNVPVCNSSQAYQTHELFLEVIDSYAGISKEKQKCSLPCIMDDINYNSAFSKGTGTYYMHKIFFKHLLIPNVVFQRKLTLFLNRFGYRIPFGFISPSFF